MSVAANTSTSAAAAHAGATRTDVVRCVAAPMASPVVNIASSSTDAPGASGRKELAVNASLSHTSPAQTETTTTNVSAAAADRKFHRPGGVASVTDDEGSCKAKTAVAASVSDAARTTGKTSFAESALLALISSRGAHSTTPPAICRHGTRRPT